MHHGMGMCPTCGCGMGHGHRMGGIMKMMFMKVPMMIIMRGEEFGLSEDQINKLRDRYAETKKQMIQIGSQIKMDMVDLHNAVMRDEINMPVAEAKVREIGKLKGDMLMVILQGMNDMRHTLTPEQHKRVRMMIMSWFRKGGMSGMGMEEDEESESEDMPEEE